MRSIARWIGVLGSLAFGLLPVTLAVRFRGVGRGRDSSSMLPRFALLLFPAHPVVMGVVLGELGTSWLLRGTRRPPYPLSAPEILLRAFSGVEHPPISKAPPPNLSTVQGISS